MMRIVILLATGALLAAAAPIKLAPADDRPAQPVGAVARARNGPAPLARPPEDVGSAEDPPGTTVNRPPSLPLPPETSSPPR